MVAMTGQTIPAATSLAGRRRAPWAAILLRVGLLLAVRGLLAALGPFAPVAFLGLFLVLSSAGVPAPLLGAAGGLVPGPFSEVNLAAGLTRPRLRSMAVGWTAIPPGPPADPPGLQQHHQQPRVSTPPRFQPSTFTSLSGRRPC
jgi:hypothetical protein